MIKHSFETQIYYFDTDCYNIVWHGAYVKWFEIGRVEYFRLAGVDFANLTLDNILLPMVDLQIRYKSPARFGDTIIITTSLNELSKITISFNHSVHDKNTNKLLVTGLTRVAVTNADGKLLQQIPDYIVDKFKSVSTIL